MIVKELRARTADHMRNNADDFLPFLTNPTTGDMFTTGKAFSFVVHKKKNAVISASLLMWKSD